MRPSMASSTVARMTAPTASSKRPSMASRMAVTPEQTASSVIRLGSRKRTGIIRKCFLSFLRRRS